MQFNILVQDQTTMIMEIPYPNLPEGIGSPSTSQTNLAHPPSSTVVEHGSSKNSGGICSSSMVAPVACSVMEVWVMLTLRLMLPLGSSVIRTDSSTKYVAMLKSVRRKKGTVVKSRARGGGILTGKLGMGMCCPERVPFQPLRFTHGPFFI